MTIVNTRVDARLIHGQVAAVWSTSLRTQRIIVVNDFAAANDVEKASLRMAAPTSMWLSILDVSKAVENIQSDRYGDQRIFLIFQTIQDVKRFVEAGGKIGEITIGNISHKDGSDRLLKSVSINQEEINAVNWLIDQGISVVVQTVPNDPKRDFQTLLNKK